MKKLFLILTIGLLSFSSEAQPPMGPQGQRPLPNQFRDFVDHQQRWNMERPQIEKKDGKVIITMSEEQFKRMQRIRIAQRHKMNHRRPEPICMNCKRPLYQSKERNFK